MWELFSVAGPASYGPVDNSVNLPSNGIYTIKSRTGNNPVCTPKEGPGPGTYNQSGGRRHNSRGFSMGIRHSPYLMPVVNGHDMTY